MGEEETKKVESEANPTAAPSEKSLVPIPDEKLSLAKTLAIPEKDSDFAAEKKSGDPTDRDAVLARVETEKRFALIKAWEESEKTKTENKAYKKLSAIGSWENSKKACVEAQLKKMEAEYTEKMKNKAAEIHKAAEEKRAMIEAKRGEDVLKVEEVAAKFRATGNTPKKFFGCFSY
ncbi:hypothetical protein CsSME_00044964 [Camellia sinensis var. sinensis]